MGWSVDATDDGGKFVQGLLWLVASTAQFQSEVGAASAVAALARCWPDEADDKQASATALWPRAIAREASLEDEELGRKDASVHGVALLTFEREVPSAYAAQGQNAVTEFRNVVGLIVRQAKALAGTGTGYFSGETHVYPQRWTYDDAAPAAYTVAGNVEGEEQQVTVAAVVYRVEWHGVPG